MNKEEKMYLSPEEEKLRDDFAKSAMEGICAHCHTWGLVVGGIAKKAYEIADEMLKARKVQS